MQEKNYILVYKQKLLEFLMLNGYELSYTQQELSETILDLASGSLNADDIQQWLINHEKE